MSKHLYYLILLLLPACDWINPTESIPSYIEIEAPILTTEAGEGTASHNITEYWVFLDDEFLGAFPIPARIPILREDTQELRIEAGIRQDGRSATPDIYPFYAPFRQNVTLVAEQTVRVTPEFRYRQNTRFAFIEDFEGGQTLFRDVVTGTAQSRMRISNEAPFEGQGSGLIQLSTTDAFVEIATLSSYQNLLANGSSVFLELNYRSEVPVSFGVIGFEQSSSEPITLAYQAGFNPSEDWNKIYFNLTPVIFGSEAEAFKIILQTALPLDENNNFALDQAQVLLDNIKLVHF